MSLDNGNFDNPPEFYQSLFQETIQKAVAWMETGKNTTEVSIIEPTLEEHFRAHWVQDIHGNTEDKQYFDEIVAWRGWGELQNLTVIRSEATNEKTFIVDTSDLVIGKPQDTFFFHMVEKCFAVVVDCESPRHESLRLAYHLPGSTTRRDSSLAEFIKSTKRVGVPKKMTVFYNSVINEPPDDAMQAASQGAFETNVIDMNQFDRWRVHDIYVKGDTVEQYYNKGNYVTESKTPSVSRVHSGTWKI